MNFIDTHCHLDTYEEHSAESFESLRERIETPPEAYIHVACDPEAFEDARIRSESYFDVFATYGIHPEYVHTYEQNKYLLPDYWEHPRCVGCGEFGLDYHYGKENKELQRSVFEDQLEMALNTQKAIVLHLREAEEDSLSILKNAPLQNTKIHVHCFTSNASFAEELLKISNNIYIGFTGIITFKNAENVRKAVEVIPLNRLLLETDAPYLAPVPHRGTPAHSGMIPHIADKIAELKNTDIENVYFTTRENTRYVYGI
jgi:TatD DNase family protein